MKPHIVLIMLIFDTLDSNFDTKTMKPHIVLIMPLFDTLPANFDNKTSDTAHCAYYAYLRHAAFEFRHQDT